MFGVLIKGDVLISGVHLERIHCNNNVKLLCYNYSALIDAPRHLLQTVTILTWIAG